MKEKFKDVSYEELLDSYNAVTEFINFIDGEKEKFIIPDQKNEK